MAIPTGSSTLVGGAYSSGGPELGDYNIVVTDASEGEAKTSGRKQLVLELSVKGDPNHPGKEGKKLITMRQNLPAESDEPDKVKTINGMLKRMCYDGFGVKWPTEPKPLDPRIFVGKTAAVRLDKREGTDASGKTTEFTNVVAVAQSLDGLPKPKAPKAAATNAKSAAASRRR